MLPDQGTNEPGKRTGEGSGPKGCSADGHFAENYYYLKQMNKKTPVAVVYTDGEVVEGYI
jgi:hypothetical protein